MRDNLKTTVTSEQSAAQVYRDIVEMMRDYGYVTVEVKASTRSLSQNALYWMWLELMAIHANVIIPESDRVDEETGEVYEFDKDDMHWKCRKMFLGEIPAKQIGSTRIEYQLKSTQKLSKHEMMTYLQQIEAFAATSMNLSLPVPSDSMYFKTRQKHEGIES
jgi:hypothetical protein